MARQFLFFVITLTVLYQSTYGQVFPLNETGRITFHEVLQVDSLSKGTLYTNAKNWLTNSTKKEKIVLDSINGKLVTKNEFSLYSAQAGVLKKLVGKFTYETQIEVKDNRYRYTFTNFIYREYKADRYHNIVPTGKTKSLEESKWPGAQKQWDKCRITINDNIQQDIISLKNKMKEAPPSQRTKPVKKEVKWEE